MFELLAELILPDCALDDFHLEMTASFVATANNGWINIKTQHPGYVLPKEQISTGCFLNLCREVM